jgi:membrane-associated phospholipid phosphatase
MNAFDRPLIEAMSHYAVHSQSVAHIVDAISKMYLFKGTLLVALLWWIWFRHYRATSRDEIAIRRRDRELVVIAIVSGFVAFLAGRLLAHYLPFRLRPVYEPALQGLYPVTKVDQLLPRTWSAFPSDHAMLWCAISMGIFLASRWLGIYAFIHTAVLIGLPRVYLGLHYPSDVIVGGLLGILLAGVMSVRPVRATAAKPVLAMARRWPGPFFALAFLLSFELATQFDEFRVIAHFFSEHYFEVS